jgi:hypothetical protein
MGVLCYYNFNLGPDTLGPSHAPRLGVVPYGPVTPGFRGHQDPGANIITKCTMTKSYTYDDS